MTANATQIRLDGLYGIDFYTDKRYTLTTRTGWDSTPGLTGSNLVVPGRHGEIWRRKDFGPARMILDIYIHSVDKTGVVPVGSNPEKQFKANLDTLFELFTRQELIEVAKTEDPQSEYYYQKVNYAEVGIVLTPTYDDGPLPGASLTVELIFPDPIWKELVVKEYTGTPSATSGRNEVLTQLAGSTAPITDAIIIVIGPITNPRLDDGYSSTNQGYIRYSGTIAAGTRWRINCATFTSEVGAGLLFNSGTGTNVMSNTLFGPGPRLFNLRPGPSGAAPSIVLTGTGMSSATQLNVQANRKFIS